MQRIPVHSVCIASYIMLFVVLSLFAGPIHADSTPWSQQKLVASDGAADD